MQWIEVCIKTTSQAIELVGERLTMLGFDSFIMDDQDEFHEFLENNKQYWDYVDEGLEKQMQGLSQIRLYLEDSPAAPETISYLKDQLRLLPQQYPSIEFGTLDVSLEHVKDEDWRTTGSSTISRSRSARSFWSCRSGCTRKTPSIAWRCCWTPA